VKFAAIANWAASKQYPVAFMCAQLGVSRSGYYAWRDRAASARARQDATLTTLIRAAHAAGRGNPGVRRIRADLAASGHRVSHKRVFRLMKAAGLAGRHPRAWKKTTVHGEQPVNAPDRIGRDFTAAHADTRWCGDITYIRTWTGWAYLATVIDLHSRAVVGWALADHMRTTLITDALTMAITHRAPAAGVIFHSDRGCQGGFRRSSQHLDHGGVRWRERRSERRRSARCPRGVDGSGPRIARCGRRCAHRGDQSRHAGSSALSGG
jgi:putative transposase